MPTHTSLLHDPHAVPGAPLVEPIEVASTFPLSSAVVGAEAAKAVAPERFYTRWGNPTVAAMERAVARLEGTDGALAFASGQGAMAAALLACAGAGDTLVASHRLYGGTMGLLTSELPRLGVQVRFVDVADTAALAAALSGGAKALVVETPSNPRLDLVDLVAVSTVAREHGVRTLADNTWATPWVTQPVAHGIDAVIHSASKGLGGHSDVIAGVVCGDAAWLEDVWRMRTMFGACLSPRDAAMVHRGIKTLGVRQERQGATAAALAAWLARDGRVGAVHYPGLPDHPGHGLARVQMRGFGAMLAFDAGDLAAAARVAEGVRTITHAVSLGGVESLICHPASTTHASLTADKLAEAAITPGLLRLSVGLEELDDLVADLDQALG